MCDPRAGPYAITTGPDDALWLTFVHRGSIGRLALDGALTEFQLDPPTCAPMMITTDGAAPFGIVTGPDDALWFTLNQANSIGRITCDGDVSLHPVPTATAGPVGITSDGETLWFVEIAAGQIGRLSPAGEFEQFPLPDRTAQPHAIVATGPGDCWFTEWGGVAADIAAGGEMTDPVLWRGWTGTAGRRHTTRHHLDGGGILLIPDG